MEVFGSFEVGDEENVLENAIIANLLEEIDRITKEKYESFKDSEGNADKEPEETRNMRRSLERKIVKDIERMWNLSFLTTWSEERTTEIQNYKLEHPDATIEDIETFSNLLEDRDRKRKIPQFLDMNPNGKNFNYNQKILGKFMKNFATTYAVNGNINKDGFLRYIMTDNIIDKLSFIKNILMFLPTKDLKTRIRTIGEVGAHKDFIPVDEKPPNLVKCQYILRRSKRALPMGSVATIETNRHKYMILYDGENFHVGGNKVQNFNTTVDDFKILLSRDEKCNGLTPYGTQSRYSIL